MTQHSRVCFVLFAKCMEKYQCQRGLGNYRHISNWVKATSLLLKHEKSDWHLVAVEMQALSLAVMDYGTIEEHLVAAKKRKGRTMT